MQRLDFIVRETEVGQTVSVTVDEVLGEWLISRREPGELILASPEIPVDAETRSHLLQAVLLENFNNTLPVKTRFCMDENHRLRLEMCTSDSDIDAAIREIAKIYAQVVDPDVYRPIDEDAPLDLEDILAEQSTEEILAEELEQVLLSQFFALLAQDADLKSHLIVDSNHTQGLIQFPNDELSILIMPDALQKRLYLYCPIMLLDDADDKAEQLEGVLSVNSMLRMGSDLCLGFVDDLTILYLRASLFVDAMNLDSVKDILGVLIATGQSVGELIDRGEFERYKSKPAQGVMV